MADANATQNAAATVATPATPATEAKKDEAVKNASATDAVADKKEEETAPATDKAPEADASAAKSVEPSAEGNEKKPVDIVKEILTSSTLTEEDREAIRNIYQAHMLGKSSDEPKTEVGEGATEVTDVKDAVKKEFIAVREEMTKAVADAKSQSFEKASAEMTKTMQALEKKVASAVEATIEKIGSVFNSKVEALEARLAAVEKVGGVSQGLNGQEDPTHSAGESKSIFGGVFSSAMHRSDR